MFPNSHLEKKIGVFFKTPVPGQVKTRLTPALSDKHAAELYEAFLIDTLDLCRKVEDAELVLFHSGHAGHRWDRQPVDLRCFEQTGGDLGARMTGALDQLLTSGAEKAILTGSDSPSLPVVALQDAFTALDRSDVVLGPTRDGGYYLIGLKAVPNHLLEGIHWSVSTVLEQTAVRAGSLGLSVTLIRPWYDVDTFDDLDRLAMDLKGDPSVAPATRLALKTLGLG